MAEAKCRCGHEYDSGTDDMKSMESRHVTCPACGFTSLCCALWPGYPFTAAPEPTEEQVEAQKESWRELCRKMVREREDRIIRLIFGESFVDSSGEVIHPSRVTTKEG